MNPVGNDHPPASSSSGAVNPKGWCIGTPNIIHSAPLERSRHVLVVTGQLIVGWFCFFGELFINLIGMR